MARVSSRRVVNKNPTSRTSSPSRAMGSLPSLGRGGQLALSSGSAERAETTRATDNDVTRLRVAIKEKQVDLSRAHYSGTGDGLFTRWPTHRLWCHKRAGGTGLECKVAVMWTFSCRFQKSRLHKHPLLGSVHQGL